MGSSIARRSSRHLIDSFAPEPLTPNALRKSPFLFLTQDDPYGVIHLFTIAVVSLGLSVSVLIPPLAGSPIRIKVCRKMGFPLRPLSAFADPENLRFQAVSNS